MSGSKAADGAASTAARLAQTPGERERDPDEPLHRQPDEHGRVEVLGDRLERAPEARAAEQAAAGGGEQERGRRDEDRARLDRRAADVPEAAVTELPEGQRVGEDVRGPVEEDDEHRSDRERDGERRRHPADDRTARAVRLDREEVRARRSPPR